MHYDIINNRLIQVKFKCKNTKPSQKEVEIDQEHIPPEFKDYVSFPANLSKQESNLSLMA